MEERREVIVGRVVYRADGDGFAVVQVDDAAAGGAFIAAGHFPVIEEGDHLALTGEFQDHPRYGRRFRVQAAEPRLPATVEGIQRYLRSGRVKGIGKKLAVRLVKAFGAETLHVLENEPERVLQVPGVGRSRLEEIRRVFAESRVQRETLVFLHGLGLGGAAAQRIWDRFGADTMGRLREDRYGLVDDVAGIGFVTADRMARELGIDPGAVERLRAGLRHTLKVGWDRGHVCLDARELIDDTVTLLTQSEDAVSAALQDAVDTGALASLAPDGPAAADETRARIYLPVMAEAERVAARRLLAIAATPLPDEALAPPPPPKGGIELTAEQENAVNVLASSKVSVLTGGPGVGKTTVLRRVVSVFEARGLSVALASPTGRAARRLADATGREAQTLHRQFGIMPPGARKVPPKPFEASVLIVDETSMLDLPLMVQVLRRLPLSVVLILVGDPDQLPSVGPGSVLADLLSCGRFPVARLTHVFRQAQGSLIIGNAHRILAGCDPVFPERGADGDCFFAAREDPQAGAEMIRRLFMERIPQRLGIDPRDGVQVLTPMHRGAVGTTALNLMLQEAVNGGNPSVELRGRRFYEGDRVMQVRNNYDLDVMNGDLGIVTQVWPAPLAVEIQFEGKDPMRLTGLSLEDVEPAFAITVHKSQGGEFPAVILPLFPEHFMMLRRNVLYTAVTRAQRLLVIVGSRRALHQAVTDDRLSRRGGQLCARLQGQPMRAVPIDHGRGGRTSTPSEEDMAPGP